MTPRIKKLQYKKNYLYTIRFEDGTEGDINFSPHLWGEAFEMLKNRSYFQKAFIDKTTGTITWPNGVDIAPETLYEKLVASSHNAPAPSRTRASL